MTNRNYAPPRGNMGFQNVVVQYIGFIDVQFSMRTRFATHSSAGSRPIRIALGMFDRQSYNIYGKWAMTKHFEGST